MQQIIHSVALVFNNLCRLYRIILGSLAAITLVVAIWQPCMCYLSSISIIQTIEAEKYKSPSLLSKINSLTHQVMQENADILKNKLYNKFRTAIIKQKYSVYNRNALMNILNQDYINLFDINHFVMSDQKICNLKILKQFSGLMNLNVDFQYVTWKIRNYETCAYNSSIIYDFKKNKKIQQGNWIGSVLKGTVGGNFVSSARKAGFTGNEIYEVIRVMQWQMDFGKLKEGDPFAALISRKILNGKREKSKLVGIRMRSGGRDYYAVRAEDGKFYDSNGASLIKGFLRFPTYRRFRVSSNFNPHRLNPVTGTVAPHRGVDFAMPQGTPVLAVGDGKVAIATRSGAAGYYVVVCHGRTYTTRYMHLHKLLVKPGQKVKRGDHIALSGNTGRSTGPHLHYEIWINKKPVNPLTTKLPYTKILKGKDRVEYLAQVQQIIPQLCFD